jgi:hypothetical protein
MSSPSLAPGVGPSNYVRLAVALVAVAAGLAMLSASPGR